MGDALHVPWTDRQQWLGAIDSLDLRFLFNTEYEWRLITLITRCNHRIRLIRAAVEQQRFQRLYRTSLAVPWAV